MTGNENVQQEKRISCKKPWHQIHKNKLLKSQKNLGVSFATVKVGDE